MRAWHRCSTIIFSSFNQSDYCFLASSLPLLSSLLKLPTPQVKCHVPVLNNWSDSISDWEALVIHSHILMAFSFSMCFLAFLFKMLGFVEVLGSVFPGLMLSLFLLNIGCTQKSLPRVPWTTAFSPRVNWLVSPLILVSFFKKGHRSMSSWSAYFYLEKAILLMQHHSL